MIHYVIFEELIIIMGTTITDLDIELKLKINTKEYLENISKKINYKKE